jgi:hypothetical protein
MTTPEMTQDQIHTAGYRAAEIAKCMDRSYWFNAYGENSARYAPHHIDRAHEFLASLAGAMGYTLTPIAAPVSEAAE